MTLQQPASLHFDAQRLLRGGPTPFEWEADATLKKRLARELGLRAVVTLGLSGRITPDGRHDLILDARLAARVIQTCVITLVPVTTEVDEAIERRYLADWVEPEEDEVEVPAEDIEPLPRVIAIPAIAREALALALPDYPRAAGATFGGAIFGPPGVAPLTDADLHPFAGLSGLRRAGGGPSRG